MINKWKVERGIRVEYRKEILRRVNEYKVSQGCCMCGSRDAVVLQFHHTQEQKKDFTIASAVNKCMSWEEIEREIAKCIVVCANDHLRIHHQIRRATHISG